MSNQTNNSQTLLLFSIGPVQDFIAAARCTRDLWSGSYLLSTLIAAALKEIQGEVIFPNIQDQPIVKGLTTSPIPSDTKIEKYLTPTLPNRFLAIIPSEQDAALEAARLTNEIVEKLKDISSEVKTNLIEKLQNSTIDQYITFDSERFDQQVDKLLEVHWQTLPVPNDIDELREMAKLLPERTDNYNPTKGLDDGKTWGSLNSIIAWLHDGAKSNRSFEAWREGRWKSGKKFNKDQLTGKEEAVFTVSPDISDSSLEKLSTSIGLNKYSLKSGELLGASSVIKRFWDSYYLTTVNGLPSDPDELRQKLPMPNTHTISQYDNKNENQTPPSTESEKYYAIIAFDGDEMGQWISGAKLKKTINKEDHITFSKVLNDFSVNHARGIIDDSTGLLIYSGGDDVLAMVPAGNSITCAQNIKDRFCSLFEENDPIKYQTMNASAGIAIAHYKAPLQDVVKAAQVAEKRAKRSPQDGGLGRAAVATTIYKRSGEILEWGTKWDSAGYKLLTFITEKLKKKHLNSRFPHKLEALLAPYLPHSSSIQTDQDFEKNFTKIIELEINHCLNRNDGGKLDDDDYKKFTTYWNELENTNTTFAKKLTLFINLLRTASWMTCSGTKEENQPNKPINL